LRGEYEVAIGTGEDNPSHRGRLMGLRIGFGAGGREGAGASAPLDGLELLRDSAYFIPHYESSSKTARNAPPSEGALRALGVVQGLLMQEEAVEHAAHSAGLSPEAVRTVNLYQKGSFTPEGRVLDDCRLDEVWERIATLSRYQGSREEAEAFNASHRTRKRGVSMIPLKHGGEPGHLGGGESYSAACAVVEIDALSGAVSVLRADLVHDPGTSPNPVSVTGPLKRAYLQGLGYLLSEEVSLQPVRPERSSGSFGAGRYEAPLASALPARLNVEIVRRGEASEGVEAPRFAFSEETCEPALALAVTAYFAARQAIRAARQGRGLEEWCFVPAPLTEDRVRQACRPAGPPAK
jgi:xanthine dehydrogenase molybdopterin-binding subunit B